jgi:hypothetical protein
VTEFPETAVWHSGQSIGTFVHGRILENSAALLKPPLHQFQGNCRLKKISLKRRKRLWIYHTITQLTGGCRIIFLIVMGLKIMGQTEFQQLILVVMTKKGTGWKRYKRRCYCNSLCS